ncbi:MAG: hypothetical protein N3A54_06990 [Patescibacteria group bacterium]|nr:hypothetical protein [Patescibacteria group bacterium]
MQQTNYTTFYQDKNIEILTVPNSHVDHSIQKKHIVQTIRVIQETNKKGQSNVGRVIKSVQRDVINFQNKGEIIAQKGEPNQRNGFLGKGFLIYCVEFPQNVGKSFCVPRKPTDKIEVLIRGNRKRGSLVAVNRTPEDTNKIVIILMTLSEEAVNKFIFVTAFYGDLAEPEAWDPAGMTGGKPKPEVINFWKRNILVKEPGTTYTPAPKEDVEFFKSVGLI